MNISTAINLREWLLNALCVCNEWTIAISRASRIQWPFQEPKLEVPAIYKAYVTEYPQKICPYMVQYLHFRILEFPMKNGDKKPCVFSVANYSDGKSPTAGGSASTGEATNT